MWDNVLVRLFHPWLVFGESNISPSGSYQQHSQQTDGHWRRFRQREIVSRGKLINRDSLFYYRSTAQDMYQHLPKLLLKDEVFTLCQSVGLLMQTLGELEARVEERTAVLQEEVKRRVEMQAAAEVY